MGLIPLDAPWPRDHEPTDAQWDAYGAYLECLMETTWLGQRHICRGWLLWRTPTQRPQIHPNQATHATPTGHTTFILHAPRRLTDGWYAATHCPTCRRKRSVTSIDTPALTAIDNEPRPLKRIIREWAEHIIDTEDTINNHDIITRAYDRFTTDTEFQLAAARDAIPVVVLEVLRDLIKSRKESVIRTPSGAVSRRKIELTAREKLARVFEGTGAGSATSILNMRKKQLLELNARDNEQIQTMSRWVAFRSDLAGRMNDTQVVGDLTSRALDQAWRKHLEPKPQAKTAD